MKKIISLFQRNYDGDRLVRDEIVPGAEWVIAGEGYATEKIDGTCCLVKDGVLFKRYDAKKGKQPPLGFIPAQEPDPMTGHWPGWLLVGDGPEDRWHREAFRFLSPQPLPDGTYELVGPKIQGNPYRLTAHQLWIHGANKRGEVPRDFAGIRAWLEGNPGIEGLVWWRSDSFDAEMVKIKRRDFGLAWPS